MIATFRLPGKRRVSYHHQNEELCRMPTLAGYHISISHCPMELDEARIVGKGRP